MNPYRIINNHIKPYRVFWGSPDVWVTGRLRLREYDLEVQMKILSLLFDEIIISPSFILESRYLRNILSRNKSLLEHKIIKFCFSNPKHNLKDYISIKAEEDTSNAPDKIKKSKSLVPNYKDKIFTRIADEWETSVTQTKRGRNLPSIITDLVTKDFLPTISNSKHLQYKFYNQLSKTINDAEYYTKYHFFESLKKCNIHPPFLGYALDRSTQAFLVGCAISTNSFASMVWPNENLPGSFQRFGMVGNLPVILSIFMNILGLEKHVIHKLNSEKILNIRNMPEWDLFQKIYLRTILSVEQKEFSTSVLSVFRKLYSNELKSQRRHKLGIFLESPFYGALSSSIAALVCTLQGIPPMTSIPATAAPIVIGNITSKIIKEKKDVYPLSFIREQCLLMHKNICETEMLSREIRSAINRDV